MRKSHALLWAFLLKVVAPHLIEKLEDSNDSDNNSNNIGVIGAGLSGLTAVLNLAKNIQSGENYAIHVFEATDRIGGRIKTADFNSKKFETGGAFINTEHQKLRNLAAEVGQNLFKKPDENAEVVTLIDDTVQVGQSYNAEILECVSLEQYEQSYLVWDYYDYESSDSIIEMLEKCNATDYYKHLAGVAMRSEMGLDPEKCPAWLLEDAWLIDANASEFHLFGNLGDEAYLYENGAESFISKILQKIDDLKNDKNLEIEFYTNSPISEISENENGVNLRIELETKTYDHVISTVSLGAYKNLLQINHPNISDNQVDFLQNFPMGTNAKLFMIFSEKWWDDTKNMDFITEDYIIWLNHDDKIYSDKNNNSHSLTVYVGGSKVQDLSNGAIHEGEILANLVAAYPGKNISDYFIESFVGDIWEAMPHFHGSYSGVPENKKEHLYVGMEETHIGSHIHFAGEAWNVDFQGYMEGAVRSGEEAANFVLNHIQESNNSSGSGFTAKQTLRLTIFSLFLTISMNL